MVNPPNRECTGCGQRTHSVDCGRTRVPRTVSDTLRDRKPAGRRAVPPNRTIDSRTKRLFGRPALSLEVLAVLTSSIGRR